MTDEELKKLSDIRNFEVKKSTVGNNRTWKPETINSFRKLSKKKPYGSKQKNK